MHFEVYLVKKGRITSNINHPWYFCLLIQSDDYHREKIKSMFYHAYDSYLIYASGFDELQPISCTGMNTWGTFSLSLIDALDTLAIMGNYTEFRRVAQHIIDNANFEANTNVSVFETNIRGMLSHYSFLLFSILKRLVFVSCGRPSVCSSTFCSGWNDGGWRLAMFRPPAPVGWQCCPEVIARSVASIYFCHFNK